MKIVEGRPRPKRCDIILAMKTNLSSVEVSPCRNRAFSLIELMIVVSIIGILTTVIVANFNSVKTKSRDGKRVSDLGNMQVALAYYFDRCREYPASVTSGKADWNLSTSCPNTTQTVTLGDYLGTVPKDPSSNASYEYIRNTDKNAYLLRTTLEQNSSVQSDSFDNAAAGSLANRYFADFGTNPILPLDSNNLLCYDKNVAPSSKLYCLSSKL